MDNSNWGRVPKSNSSGGISRAPRIIGTTADAVLATKAVIDGNYIEACFRALKRIVLNIADKHPVTIPARLYSAHAKLLDLVLASVRKLEPIEQTLVEIEESVKSTITKIIDFVKLVEEIPQEPFEGITSQLFELWLNIGNQQKYIDIYNSYLQEYETLIIDSLSTAQGYDRNFSLLLQDTSQKMDDLRAEIKIIKKNNPNIFLKIFSAAIEKKLDLLQFDLMTGSILIPTKRTKNLLQTALEDLNKRLDEVKEYKM